MKVVRRPPPPQDDIYLLEATEYEAKVMRRALEAYIGGGFHQGYTDTARKMKAAIEGKIWSDC